MHRTSFGTEREISASFEREGGATLAIERGGERAARVARRGTRISARSDGWARDVA